MRRLTRGVEIGRYRVFWTKKNWRSKTHPYWFFRRYNHGGSTREWTFQSMRLEIWKRAF
jgi:hypothetical protein